MYMQIISINKDRSFFFNIPCLLGKVLLIMVIYGVTLELTGVSVISLAFFLYRHSMVLGAIQHLPDFVSSC